MRMCRRNWNSETTSEELPEGLVSIGSVAFGECGSLASITIPKSVTEIGKNAFYEYENLVVRVYRGSAAELYCTENGLNFEYAD